MYSSKDPNPEISNITVIGNTFSGSKRGIAVTNSRSGITISNNSITNSPDAVDGMRIEGNKSVNNTYTYNTISVIPALTGDHAGIRFLSGSTGNAVMNNIISGYPYEIKDEVGGNMVNPNP